MTSEERKDTAAAILIFLEPTHVHFEGCPGKKDPLKCTCYQRKNAYIRAAALDEAGLLCALNEIKESDGPPQAISSQTFGVTDPTKQF